MVLETFPRIGNAYMEWDIGKASASTFTQATLAYACLWDMGP